MSDKVINQLFERGVTIVPCENITSGPQVLSIVKNRNGKYHAYSFREDDSGLYGPSCIVDEKLFSADIERALNRYEITYEASQLAEFRVSYSYVREGEGCVRVIDELVMTDEKGGILKLSRVKAAYPVSLGLEETSWSVRRKSTADGR